jgi:hypothetical protein
MPDFSCDITKLVQSLSAPNTAPTVRDIYRQELIDIRNYINLALDTDSDKRAEENIKRMKKILKEETKK